jgi:hypothetical protein
MANETAFTPINSTGPGTLLTAAAAVDGTHGNKCANPTGRAIIEITNGAAGAINVTFTTQANYNVVGTSGNVTYAVADSLIAVTNATSKVFGPFDKSLYNDTNGNVIVNYSSGTSITARVIEVFLA